MSVVLDDRRLRGVAPLRAGDRVALVAPAGRTGAEPRLRSESLLRSWGLEPVTYPSATAEHPRASYLSGPDEQRALDVQEAWCDESVAGIFALRGGYGSIRILDLLDRDRMRAARPKPFYGSSDLTALHEWLREELGTATWFTPMIGTLSLLDDSEATGSLRAAVLEGWEGRRWSARAAEILSPGMAHGTLVGGNLSLLAMTLGARRRLRVDNTGTIALLEDITEDTYRIDGYLTSLLRAGWFDGVAAIALGSWDQCSPLAEINEVCRVLLEPLGVPMVSEFGFGHGPAAPSIPLGLPGTLIAEPGRPPELVVGLSSGDHRG